MASGTAFGWAGSILDVDLTTGRVGRRDTAPYARDWIGGRALALRIAHDEMPPDAGPYDPENRVIVMTGPLTGTLAPTAGRCVMTSISPRVYPTPWHTHSTLGGWFGPALKYAGFDGIVISGAAAEPVILEVLDGSARLVPAGDLWGKDARETQLALKSRYGADAQMLTIGPAGENLVRFATVQHSEENAAGHSGFGAVWGSKRLKAIVARGSGQVAVADPSGLLAEVRKLGTFRTTPSAGGPTRRQDGRQRPVCSQSCTFNCLTNSYRERADGRRVPGVCIGGAAWMSEDHMRHTAYDGRGVTIPPSPNFGLDREPALHEECNSLGLDLWFRLVMHPWLIRARELGVEAIRGFAIEPADAGWFREFMRDLAYRRGLGALFADDLRRAMDDLAGELPAELIDLGNRLEFAFGFPAHREGRFWDEEPLPFWVISALMYASESRDPTIGTHQSVLLLADLVMADAEPARRQLRALGECVWGDPDALAPTLEGKEAIAIWAQRQHVLLDSLTMCDFAFPLVMRHLEPGEDWRNVERLAGDTDLGRRLLNAVTGLGLTQAELDRIAERAIAIDRAMLARAGRDRRLEEDLAEHFRLPCRADGTLVEREGFSALLDSFYATRGWDRERGYPTRETLASLGLSELAVDFGL